MAVRVRNVTVDLLARLRPNLVLPDVEVAPCATVAMPTTPRMATAIKIEIALRDRLEDVILLPL